MSKHDSDPEFVSLVQDHDFFVGLFKDFAVSGLTDSHKTCSLFVNRSPNVLGKMSDVYALVRFVLSGTATSLTGGCR